MFDLAREVGKFGDVLVEKMVTLSRLVNSDMVKPKKFDHLHLVYHFVVPICVAHREIYFCFWLHNKI